jgi:hypothetical protein
MAGIIVLEIDVVTKRIIKNMLIDMPGPFVNIEEVTMKAI